MRQDQQQGTAQRQGQQRPVESFAFKEGYYAFSRGWLESKYHEETTKGKEWLRGFNAAYFHNVERLEQRAYSSGG